MSKERKISIPEFLGDWNKLSTDSQGVIFGFLNFEDLLEISIACARKPKSVDVLIDFMKKHGTCVQSITDVISKQNLCVEGVEKFVGFEMAPKPLDYHYSWRAHFEYNFGYGMMAENLNLLFDIFNLTGLTSVSQWETPHWMNICRIGSKVKKILFEVELEKFKKIVIHRIKKIGVNLNTTPKHELFIKLLRNDIEPSEEVLQALDHVFAKFGKNPEVIDLTEPEIIIIDLTGEE